MLAEPLTESSWRVEDANLWVHFRGVLFGSVIALPVRELGVDLPGAWCVRVRRLAVERLDVFFGERVHVKGLRWAGARVVSALCREHVLADAVAGAVLGACQGLHDDVWRVVEHLLKEGGFAAPTTLPGRECQLPVVWHGQNTLPTTMRNVNDE